MRKLVSLSVLFAVQFCTTEALYNWDNWTDWGACNATCDGLQYRSRKCMSHLATQPISKGTPVDSRLCNKAANSGGDLESRQCSGVCPEMLETLSRVARAYSWTTWSSWSSCHVTCGGQSTRQRMCHQTLGNTTLVVYAHLCSRTTSPSTSRYDYETKDCSSTPCLAKHRERRAYSWGPWKSWSSCSATCGGTMNRERDCKHTGVNITTSTVSPLLCSLNHGGSARETTSCGDQCPAKHRERRAYDWGPWMSWSSCNATCGGKMSRQRECKQHGVNITMSTVNEIFCRFEHNFAGGDANETVSCGAQCPVSHWSLWSDWSVCSVTCDTGTRYRARHCEDGSDCVGDVFQQESCTPTRCLHPVDGEWSPWDDWSSCTATCGLGYNVRYRTCSDPAPQDGGANCQGKHDEIRICPTVNCPIDGGWGNWTGSHCTASCGVGVLYSTRLCNNPEPMYGGKECVGPTTMFDKCTKPDCVIDGGWSEWGNYTTCQVVCGDGIRRRTRTCTNPVPAAGGLDCAGEKHDRMECNNGVCPPDIKVCNKTQIQILEKQSMSVQPSNCSTEETLAKASQVLEAYCDVPADKSKWRLGIKIHGNCESIPLYTPVGSTDNGLHIKEYGVMLECYENMLKMVSRSCNNNAVVGTYNLTEIYNSVHMILFES